MKGVSLKTKGTAMAAALALGVAVFGSATLADEEHHHDHDHGEKHSEKHDEKHGEHRDLGSHVHGVAELGIAADGESLVFEFESPAANIIGFEHAPKTDEQEQAVASALTQLEDGAKIFSIDAKAGCAFKEAKVVSPFEASHKTADTPDKHGHGEDGHAKHDARDKDDSHEAHKDHDHDHDHGDGHAAGDVHSEFTAQYAFTCGTLSAMRSIEVSLFETFPGIEEINAVFLGDNLQFGVDLTKKNTSINVPGA